MPETAEMVKKEAEVKEGVERTRSGRVYTPTTNIIERKDDIVLIADIPGVDEKSLDVTLEKNMLTIYGKADTATPGNHRLVASEYGIGDYQRVFTVSDEIDREKIQASVKNGILRLTLPKAETVKTRKIAVKAE